MSEPTMDVQPQRQNIYQRLHAVMKEVAYVQKDAEINAGGRYKAVTHDMVTAATRPHFVRAGIVIVPRLIEGRTVDTGRKTSGGTPIIRFEGLYEVAFVNIDDPTDVCPIQVAAHAEDQGDKAPGKALSYAVKSAVLKVLLLESGENDEGRMPERDKPEPLSDAELDGLKTRLGKARDKVELRAALKEAFTVAETAQDRLAHGAIKAFAETLSLNLPETFKAAA